MKLNQDVIFQLLNFLQLLFTETRRSFIYFALIRRKTYVRENEHSNGLSYSINNAKSDVEKTV